MIHNTTKRFSLYLLVALILCSMHAQFFGVYAHPKETVYSCNSDGGEKFHFDIDDQVYADGAGYTPGGGPWDLHVVRSKDWNNLEDIGRVRATVQVSADDEGRLKESGTNKQPVPIWKAGEKCYYDIIVDLLNNGKYDKGQDPVDSDTPGEHGFSVCHPDGGIIVPIDKVGLLAPHIGVVSAILVATVAAAIHVKRVKRGKEKQ